MIEAGAHLQEGADAPVDVDGPLRGRRHPGQELEKRALSRAVPADEAQGLPLVDRQVDVLQGQEVVPHQLLCLNGPVGVFLSPHPGPPGLQVLLQRPVADLAQAVALGDAGHLYRDLIHS